ncbi:MAG: hypothetical protein CBB60_001605 [Armatimonadetes bacterium Cent15-Ar3]|nr:MAG: hypothetical protein CBB60_001605 [Armatimonadetes bacterium Cent15-Ar3]
MTDSLLGLRAQDVESGLQALEQLPTFLSSEFKKSFLSGKAARLATHISGAEVFEADDIQRLELVAGTLGIDPLLLPQVLDVMEEMEFVSVRSSGRVIKQVRETIPQYGNLYAQVGAHLRSQEPGEVEMAAIATFASLVETPTFNSAGLPMSALDAKYRVPVSEVADAAGLIRTSSVDLDRQITFSPQYWDENVTKTAELLEVYGDGEFKEVYSKVRTYPGTPILNLEPDERSLLEQLAAEGLFPSPDVKGLRGTHQFAFLPYNKFDEPAAIQSKLIEKVRALIACVRYGQYYGSASKILYPAAILRTLRDKKSLSPHSDHYSQYRLLYDLGIVRVERVSSASDRFIPTLIDTPDNIRALDVAISMISSGTPLEATLVNQPVKDYALDATYQEPVVSRATRKKDFSPRAQALIYNAMADIITQ